MANKDQFFAHDYNPTTDPKVKAMIAEYGDWGYGLFWRIVEALHREPEHSLPLKKYVFQSFVQQPATSVEQVQAFVQSCILDYELFIEEDGVIHSCRVDRNIDRRASISESRSVAGRASAEARRNATSVEQVLTDDEQPATSVEQNSTKEKKGKEKKEKETLFERFYDSYGRKVSRQDAVRAWMKIDLDLMPGIIEAAKRFKASQRDVQFQPHPASWLNGKRWEDEQTSTGGATVVFFNPETASEGTMSLENWQRHHENNPSTPLKRRS